MFNFYIDREYIEVSVKKNKRLYFLDRIKIKDLNNIKGKFKYYLIGLVFVDNGIIQSSRCLYILING